MTRSSRLLFGAFGAALSALVAAAPVARAADPAPTDVSKAIDPDACANGPDEAAQKAERQKRDEALADLGRRLSDDAAAEGGGISLNRSGHNYGPEDVSPVAPPAAH